MATWEDGPEYAPIERPDGFSVPDVAPLTVAPPHLQPAANAPVQRPAFGDPAAPVIALADLVPAAEESRDPTLPYDVASSALTSGDSAWSAVHWRPPTSPISPSSPTPWGMSATAPGGWGTSAANGSWPSAPLNPQGPMHPPNPPAHGPTGFPAPGTAQWFGPAPYAPPPAPVQVTAKDVVTAVTPALLIVLGLGGLIHPVAPITLIVAWTLSTRTSVAKQQIRVAFVVAVAALAVLGLFLGFAGALDFADWWNGLSWVALVISWGLFAAVLALATRALKAGERPSRRPAGWG
jgi:hypothetical protein